MVERELQEVFEDSERPCTADDITRLKYLECCIKEALRLYPPAFAIERTIGEEIELDGYRLESGTTVALQIYSMHRNEKYFPDALAFKPERFLNNTEDGSSEFRNPFTFVPFSAGPRNCIGIYS